jgi:predicted Zn-dependent protease
LATLDITALIEEEKLDEAETTVNQGLAEYPNNANLLYNLAVIQHLKKQDAEAKETALKALFYAPEDDQIRLFLAERSLEADLAQEAMSRILEVSPEGRQSARGQTLLGAIQTQMNNWPEAEKAFRAALELGAPEALVKSSLAYVLFRQNRMEEGSQFLKEADAERQKSETSLRQIAECYLALGNAQEAKRIVYSLSPEKQNDARLWSVIGRAELTLLAFGEAESTFTRALACPNSTPWNLVEYANMLFAAQREDEALQKALEAEEKITARGERITNPHLYNLLATLYARRNQLHLAQQYLQQSLDVDFSQTKVRSLLDKLNTTATQPEPLVPAEEPILEEIPGDESDMPPSDDGTPPFEDPLLDPSLGLETLPVEEPILESTEP